MNHMDFSLLTISTYARDMLEAGEVHVLRDWFEPRPGAHLRTLLLKGIEFQQWQLNCQVCCKPHYNGYMVLDPLWLDVMGKEGGGIICMSCFENKLGRPLTLEDMTDAPINDPFRKGHQMQKEVIPTNIYTENE